MVSEEHAMELSAEIRQEEKEEAMHEWIKYNKQMLMQDYCEMNENDFYYFCKQAYWQVVDR